MKKIILLIMLLIPIINVEAQEIVTYSDSNNYIYSEQKLNADNLVEVNKIRKYKWYKDKIILSENTYLEKPIEFDYKSNIYERIDYSNWSTRYPTNSTNIEERIATYYKEYRSIRYIRFNPSKDIKLSELNIFYDKKEIDYTIVCGQCNINVFNKIKDNNKEETITINKGMSILINMVLPLKIENLEFEIYSKDIDNLTLTFNGDYFVETPDYSIDINSSKKKYNFHDAKILSTPLEHTYVTYEDVKNKIIYIQIQKKEYRTYTRKYKYYNLIKEYLDDYYENKEGYIKDNNKYKDYYKYKIVNKIITNNNVKYLDKIIKVPEKEIKYQTKIFPVEKTKYIKEKSDDNKIEKYGIYTLIGVILKKMSIFGR